MANTGSSSRSELFLVLPWWFNLVLAAVSYVVLKWLLPDILSSHSLPLLASGSQYLAGFAVAGFVFLGGFIFMKQRESDRRASAATQGEPERAPSGAKVRSDPAPGARRRGADAHQEKCVDAKLDSFMLAKPREWSLELLRSLEWKRLEDLACGFYTELGFRTMTLRHGADAYPIVELYWGDAALPIALIHCEKNGAERIEADAVRELHATMLDRKVAKGVLLTSLDFSGDAYALAGERDIELINGRTLLNKLLQLLPQRQREMLLAALEGDYLTPSCNFCGAKMTRRPTVLGDSWSCLNPRCGEALIWPTRLVA